MMHSRVEGWGGGVTDQQVWGGGVMDQQGACGAGSGPPAETSDQAAKTRV